MPRLPRELLIAEALGRNITLLASAEADQMSVTLVSDDNGALHLVFIEPGSSTAQFIASNGPVPRTPRHPVSEEPEVIQHLWSAAFGPGDRTRRPANGWMATTGIAAADAVSVHADAGSVRSEAPVGPNGRFLLLRRGEWQSTLTITVTTKDDRQIPALLR